MGKANNTKSKKLPSWFGAAIAGVVAVAVVVISIYTGLAGSGFFVRHNTVAQSEDYSLSETELSYLTMMQYQSFYNNYYYYIEYANIFGNVLSLNTSALDDTIKGADAGYTADPDFEGTWREYFIDQAKRQAQFILGCLQLGKKEGMDLSLSEDSKDAIDNAIDQIEAGYESYISQYCSTYGVTTMVAKNNLPLSSYYASNYGTGVKESDVRSLLKKYYLATQISNEKGDGISEALLQAEVDEYLEKNKNNYLYADYLSQQISYTENVIDKNVSDYLANAETTEEGKANYAFYDGQYGYKVACEKVDALVESLATVTTEEDFKTQLGDFLAWAAEAKSYYDTLDTEMKSVTAAVGEEAHYEALKTAHEKALEEVVSDMDAEIKTEYDAAIEELEDPTDEQKAEIRKKVISEHYADEAGTATEDVAYSKTSSALNDWIFGNAEKDKLADGVEKCDPAKQGAIYSTEAKAETGTTTDKLKTYSFTAYRLTEAAHLQEDAETQIANNVAYAAFESEADAKAFLEAVNADPSKKASGNAFKEFGESKNAYASVFYRNMKTGAFSDDDKVVDEWLEKEDTKVGDLTILNMDFTDTSTATETNESGETIGNTVTTYYCVFFYVSVGESYARADARADLTADKLEEWYNAVDVDFESGIFEKIFSFGVGTSAPSTEATTQATTAAPATDAATDAATNAATN